MDKKEQLEFLREMLKLNQQLYLENEVLYRGTQSMQIAGISGGARRSEQAEIQERTARLNKENLELKIRMIRELIKEVENGKFVA